MNLNTIFKAYEDLQATHLESLETESLPDLKTMTEERERAFSDLKKNLGKALENTDPDFLKTVETRLAGIMKADDRITLKIKHHREMLLARMKQIRHGKKAMEGYRQPGSPSRPAVLNMNR